MFDDLRSFVKTCVGILNNITRGTCFDQIQPNEKYKLVSIDIF